MMKLQSPIYLSFGALGSVDSNWVCHYMWLMNRLWQRKALKAHWGGKVLISLTQYGILCHPEDSQLKNDIKIYMSLGHKELTYPNIIRYVMSDIYFKNVICRTFFCMEYSRVYEKKFTRDLKFCYVVSIEISYGENWLTVYYWFRSIMKV